MGVGKDGLSNPVGDVVSNVGSPLQAGGPPFPRADTDMLMKVPVHAIYLFIFITILQKLPFNKILNCKMFRKLIFVCFCR